MPADHTLVKPPDPRRQRIWDYVSRSPLPLGPSGHSLASCNPAYLCKAFLEDNLLSRAAELGFFFLFALFPTLISVTSILGLVARRATLFYIQLLGYLALVIPRSAFNIVLDTFNQTAAASTTGKITFGLVAALWSASVGFSAIQDSLNTVYKVKETRPYWKARLSAILVTLLLAVINTLALATLLSADILSRVVRHHVYHHALELAIAISLQVFAWVITFALVALFFAVIYYFAPDVKSSVWRWFSPGAAIGIFGWILASLGLRIYLHYFNTYSLTYGSLGAVVILLTWFYIATGLMLLLGAGIDAIEAAVVEKRLATAGLIYLMFPLLVIPQGSAIALHYFTAAISAAIAFAAHSSYVN